MKSKVILLLWAAAIVAVAAINVNVFLHMKEKVSNLSLSNVIVLANNEYYIQGTVLYALSEYKMTMSNTNKVGGMAIQNNPFYSIGVSCRYEYGYVYCKGNIGRTDRIKTVSNN